MCKGIYPVPSTFETYYEEIIGDISLSIMYLTSYIFKRTEQYFTGNVLYRASVG